ncbi:hypothetical protein Dimus_001159 [Dionaea muscipula]
MRTISENLFANSQIKDEEEEEEVDDDDNDEGGLRVGWSSETASEEVFGCGAMEEEGGGGERVIWPSSGASRSRQADQPYSFGERCATWMDAGQPRISHKDDPLDMFDLRIDIWDSTRYPIY